VLNIYLDESGDLGWTINPAPGEAGSSQHLTICAILAPEDSYKYLKRTIRDFCVKHKIPKSVEPKGEVINGEKRLDAARRLVAMLGKHPEISIVAITVKKANVEPHIRTDPNKLYNWMIRLALLDLIKDIPEVRLVPDKRSIKVESGNSLPDYLQTTLWFELGSQTTLHYQPLESSSSKGLQLVHLVANIIWRHHERGERPAFLELLPHITEKHLFF
jgi:hypothetical protein